MNCKCFGGQGPLASGHVLYSCLGKKAFLHAFTWFLVAADTLKLPERDVFNNRAEVGEHPWSPVTSHYPAFRHEWNITSEGIFSFLFLSLSWENLQVVPEPQRTLQYELECEEEIDLAVWALTSDITTDPIPELEVKPLLLGKIPATGIIMWPTQKETALPYPWSCSWSVIVFVSLCLQFSSVDLDQPLFQPFPSEIIFQNYIPCEVHEVPLVLRNNDKVHLV